VCRADNLATFMCRLSRSSGSLNLLEHSGPAQACNGITLPLPRRKGGKYIDKCGSVVEGSTRTGNLHLRG